MTTLRHILDAHLDLSGPAALATIVKAKGSSYRRAGARLLIRADGSTVGMISGGCLEHDVVEKALKIVKTGLPQLAVFDMTGTDDELWGYGQGCNGVISVLIEPLGDAKIPRQFQFLRECLTTRTSGVLGSVFRVEGEVATHVGSHLMLRSSGEVEETIRHPVVSSALAEAARDVLAKQASITKEFRFTDGSVEAFLEFVRPPVHLVVAGGGQDAIPVAAIATQLGWDVSIIDHRPAYADAKRFPKGSRVILTEPQGLDGKITVDDRTAVLVMTHHFQHDCSLLRHFLSQNSISYVGLLGPAKRKDLILKRLSQDGFQVSSDQLHRLHGPVGLDIGSEEPEEIALAVIAEIQTVLSRREGGFMNDHSGPLHP